nr:Hemin transport protein [Pseudoxanthomonas sp.]
MPDEGREPARLPRPQQLAALGAVLCLYRAEQGGELAGWELASDVQVRAGLDSDGLRESLQFVDAGGRCCWRLFLLPDSDFLAWDRLLSRWPQEAGMGAPAGVGERLWRRLAGRLRGEQWRAAVLRLHELPGGEGRPVLAASLARLSSLGAATARAIARGEGVDYETLSDECCCLSSAPSRARDIPHGSYPDAVISWKPNERTHA